MQSASNGGPGRQNCRLDQRNPQPCGCVTVQGNGLSQPVNVAQSDSRRLEREVERLSRENEKLRGEVTERDRKLVGGRKTNRRVGGADRRLRTNAGVTAAKSTTSSKPPSSDGLAGEQRQQGTRRKKSRRNPGGQPGHRGHWRGLAPLSRDWVIEVFPPRCRHCDSRLSRKVSTQGEPRRLRP